MKCMRTYLSGNSVMIDTRPSMNVLNLSLFSVAILSLIYVSEITRINLFLFNEYSKELSQS